MPTALNDTEASIFKLEKRDYSVNVPVDGKLVPWRGKCIMVFRKLSGEYLLIDATDVFPDCSRQPTPDDPSKAAVKTFAEEFSRRAGDLITGVAETIGEAAGSVAGGVAGGASKGLGIFGTILLLLIGAAVIYFLVYGPPKLSRA